MRLFQVEPCKDNFVYSTVYSVEWLQRKYQLSFERLWNEKEFADVTLVCEDDQQMEAHKIMLANLSTVMQHLNIIWCEKHKSMEKNILILACLFLFG